MPRLERDPPQRMFRPSELRRLMSMIFLLGILFFVIRQTHQEGSWRWLVARVGDKDQVVGHTDDRGDAPETTPAPADQGTAAAGGSTNFGSADAKSADAVPSPAKSIPAESPAPPAVTPPAVNTPPAISPPSDNPAEKTQPADVQPAADQPQKTPAPKLPPATGPTDEDSREAAAAPKDFDLVFDRTADIKDVEEAAYERILRWVVHQPYERLAGRANVKNPTWGQFITSPDESRRPGRIYQLDVHIRKVEKLVGTNSISAPGAPEAPVQLYSMWGDTKESRGRFFQLIVYEPPGGIPIGMGVQQDVRFVGYFFKTEIYEAASSTPTKPVEFYAPTLIGRVALVQIAPTEFANGGDWIWLAILGGGTLLILGTSIGWMLLRRKSMKSALQGTDLRIPQSRSIDDWLTQPRDSGAEGNNSLDSDESLSEEARERADRNGHSGNGVRLFGDPQEGGDPLDN